MFGFVCYTVEATGEVREHGDRLYVSQWLKQIYVEVNLRNLVVVHLLELVGINLFIIGDLNLPSLNESLETIMDARIQPSDKSFLDRFNK